jgi:hypothetical protein
MRQLFSVATGEKDSDADETNPSDIISIGVDMAKKDAAPKINTDQAEAIFMEFVPVCETEAQLREFWAENVQARNVLKEHNPEALKRVTAAFTKRKVELTNKDNDNGN